MRPEKPLPQWRVGETGGSCASSEEGTTLDAWAALTRPANVARSSFRAQCYGVRCRRSSKREYSGRFLAESRYGSTLVKMLQTQRWLAALFSECNPSAGLPVRRYASPMS